MFFLWRTRMGVFPSLAAFSLTFLHVAWKGSLDLCFTSMYRLGWRVSLEVCLLADPLRGVLSAPNRRATLLSTAFHVLSVVFAPSERFVFYPGEGFQFLPEFHVFFGWRLRDA